MGCILYVVLGFLLCPWHAFAAEEKVFYAAPSQLAGTTEQMRTAGFWIGRDPLPDQPVMSSVEIDAFNARIQDELKLTKDIFAVTDNFKTEYLVTDFDKMVGDVTNRGYYTVDGVRDNADFIDQARRNMNLSGVVLGIAPRYGLVVRSVDVRFLPTDEGLYESAGDIDFDQLQNSSLDIGTPVAVVHQSLDKKWDYVLSSLSDGWVQADRVALGEAKTVRDFVHNKTLGVVIAPKADVFLNEEMTKYYDHLRMGTHVVVVGSMGDRTSILLPTLGHEGKLQMVSGYMKSADVHEGYLPYTPRSIYNQAFAMLNQPYGWGGARGEQDCSAFLDEVFSTVGIVLPRDSKNQALVGDVLAAFDEKSTNDQKLQALTTAPGALAVLPMKGHIMLYLGSIDGKPYVIHDLWAYREHKGDKDIPRVINRVAVSDLSLGEGSSKGSLLKRLSKIIEVK